MIKIFFESNEGTKQSNHNLFLKIIINKFILKIILFYFTTDLGAVAILELTYLPTSTNPSTVPDSILIT